MNEPYELIRTNGYCIHRKVYDSLDAAKKAMQVEYFSLNDNDEGDDWDEQSYMTHMNALLYNKGKEVYCWRIFKI